MIIYSIPTFICLFIYFADNEGYYGWSADCRCNERLTLRLDGALKSAKRHLGKYKNGHGLENANLEEYEFNDGYVRGVEKLERKGPYRCSVSRKYARIYFRIGFVELLIRYSVSLVEGRFLNNAYRPEKKKEFNQKYFRQILF